MEGLRIIISRGYLSNPALASEGVVQMSAINNHTASVPAAKPFLKWAGGKGQLLNAFRELYPVELREKRIKNFYEPFVGSGAVFFEVMQQFEVDNAYLYDINEELVLTYRVIQQDISPLIDCLQRCQKTFLKLDKEGRSQYYYEQRTCFNQQRFQIDYHKYRKRWINRAAQLIFLNHTCFNGLYRVNSKGAFNTPLGDYANPIICQTENLLRVSALLARANIKKADFNEVAADLKPSSFIYFDPPYRPLSKTASFTAYSKMIFGEQEQLRLSVLFKQLDAGGSRVMLSNSDPKNLDPNDDFFDKLYSDFTITRVPAKRMINSNASKRGHVMEIVVTNYALPPLP